LNRGWPGHGMAAVGEEFSAKELKRIRSCRKAYRRQKRVKIGAMIGRGLEDRRCRDCGKSFLRPEHLRAHLTRETPCERVFAGRTPRYMWSGPSGTELALARYRAQDWQGLADEVRAMKPRADSPAALAVFVRAACAVLDVAEPATLALPRDYAHAPVLHALAAWSGNTAALRVLRKFRWEAWPAERPARCVKRPDYRWDSWTWCAAVAAGRLEVLEWLALNGCPWRPHVYETAARSENRAVQWWALEQRHRWPRGKAEVRRALQSLSAQRELILCAAVCPLEVVDLVADQVRALWPPAPKKARKVVLGEEVVAAGA
jgi:hypothetical protein